MGAPRACVQDSSLSSWHVSPAFDRLVPDARSFAASQRAAPGCRSGFARCCCSVHGVAPRRDGGSAGVCRVACRWYEGRTNCRVWTLHIIPGLPGSATITLRADSGLSPPRLGARLSLLRYSSRSCLAAIDATNRLRGMACL